MIIVIIIIIALYYMYIQIDGLAKAECYISISRTNKEQIKQSYRLCNENMLLNKCETYFTEYTYQGITCTLNKHMIIISIIEAVV